MYKKATLRLLAVTAVLLALHTAFIVIVDPWFHYHKPLQSIRYQYLVELENCCELDAGLIRSWEYDSILIGSSMANNILLPELEQKMGGQFIKLSDTHTFAFDVTALRYALQRRPVRQIVFDLDPFSLESDIPKGEAVPTYLFDESLLNDYRYIFNIDIASKALKTLTRQPDYRDPFQWLFDDGGDAQKVLSVYGDAPRTPIDPPQQAYSAISANVAANLAMLRALIEEHPDVQFFFFFPPYGALMWRSEALEGMMGPYCDCIRQAVTELLPYPNVTVSFFCDMPQTVDLDLYCDTIHPIPSVLTDMVEHFDDPACRITDAAQLESHFETLQESAYNFDFSPWE